MKIKLRGLAPVIEKNRFGSLFRRLVGVAGNDMRVQGRLQVAEHFVVDAGALGHPQERIAQPRHVAQEHRAGLGVQRVEVRHHRIGQQQAVAAQHLRVAQHGPAALHARDHARIVPGPGLVNSAMNRSHCWSGDSSQGWTDDARNLSLLIQRLSQDSSLGSRHQHVGLHPDAAHLGAQRLRVGRVALGRLQINPVLLHQPRE